MRREHFGSILWEANESPPTDPTPFMPAVQDQDLVDYLVIAAILIVAAVNLLPRPGAHQARST